jgi:ubiquinone/menaquinone biosynthesis C-methylase UbiE
MSDDALARALSYLSPYEREFFRIEIDERPPELYRERLRGLGFQNLGKVIDLACGLGQWSLALAETNEFVAGVDIATHRLFVANVLATSRNVHNVDFRWASIEELPYGANEFDGAFCYGAFMFPDGERVLPEVRRVLKPGAPFYVNANGLGWYLHRLQSRRTVRAAIDFTRAAGNRLLGRYRDTIYSRKRLTRLLEKHGFVIDTIADEGAIGGTGRSLYPGRLLGMDAVFEVLARKA